MVDMPAQVDESHDAVVTLMKQKMKVASLSLRRFQTLQAAAAAGEDQPCATGATFGSLLAAIDGGSGV